MVWRHWVNIAVPIVEKVKALARAVVMICVVGTFLDSLNIELISDVARRWILFRDEFDCNIVTTILFQCSKLDRLCKYCLVSERAP